MHSVKKLSDLVKQNIQQNIGFEPFHKNNLTGKRHFMASVRALSLYSIEETIPFLISPYPFGAGRLSE